MKVSFRWRSVARLSCLLMAAPFAASIAQSSTAPGDVGSDLETRASLEAQAVLAESQHRTAEAWLLRTRLRQGDFQEGDKVLVKLLGTASLTGQAPGNDTVTVRTGKLLPLPQMADLPLEGVLKSELTATLENHLAKYLRDSSVRVTPLLRLAVLGQVRNPGYFYVPADILLNDAVMRAGGPNPTADVGNMIIRRGTEVIWNAQDTRTALSDGLSLDRLHLRAGDELYVDDLNHSVNFTQIMQYVGPLVGILTLLLSRLGR